MVGCGKARAGIVGPVSPRSSAVPRLVGDLAGCAGTGVLEGRRGGLMGGRGRLHSRLGHQGELRPLWVGPGAYARLAGVGVGTPWGRGRGAG